MTAVAGSVFTAAQFNQYLRDNLNQTAPALATTAGQYFVATGTNAIAARAAGTAEVATSQTTVTTTYTDLATVGPAVTLTTGTQAIITLYGWISNSAGGNSLMGCAVSGASAINPADDSAAFTVGSSLSDCVITYLLTGLTAGSNTFTAKYRVSSQTGTFVNRRILVMPL